VVDINPKKEDGLRMSTQTAVRLAEYPSKKEILRDLAAMSDFTPENIVLKRWGQCHGIAFDPARREAIIINDGRLIRKSFDDFLEARVEIDGEIVSRANLLSTVVGAAAGAFFAGGVGAIIGGSTGSRVSHERVKNVRVVILINDLERPSVAIDFIELTLWGATFPRVAIEEANRLVDFLKVVIHQSLNPAAPSLPASPPTTASS
jgi:hypothetical protein